MEEYELPIYKATKFAKEAKSMKSNFYYFPIVLILRIKIKERNK